MRFALMLLLLLGGSYSSAQTTNNVVDWAGGTAQDIGEGGGGAVDTRSTAVQTTGKGATLTAGGTTQVFSVASGNAGTITLIHMSIVGLSGSDYTNLYANSTVNIACDGGLITVPFGTFFLFQDSPVAFDLDQIDLPLGAGAGGQTSVNRRLHINFTNGCTITLANASSTSAAQIWVDVTYKKGTNTTDPATMAHWNAVATSYPSVPANTGTYNNGQVALLPYSSYSGGGQLESITQFVSSGISYSYLEGTPIVTADGTLSLEANGGEDFFECGFYCNNGAFSVRTNRVGLLIGSTGLTSPSLPYDSLGYRFFTNNPNDYLTFASTLSVGTANGYPGYGTIGNAAFSGLVTYYTASPNVSQVQYSPSPGISYSSGQKVTLTEPTASAVICYTTTGSAPMVVVPGTCPSGSTTYSAPIALTTTPITINAVGTESGYNSSIPVPMGPYTIGGAAAVSYTGNTCGIYSSVTATTMSCGLAIANAGDTAVVNLISNGYTSVAATCGTASLLRTTSWASGVADSYVFYIPNATAGSCTVTATFPSQQYTNIQGADIAHANTTSPIDNTSCTTSPYCSATGTGTSLTGAPITTTNAGELVVSFGMLGGSGPLTGTGTTANVLNPEDSAEMVSMSYEASAGATVTPTFTSGTSANWVVTAVALTP